MAPMEKLDRRILSLLARDGRMSYTDIGKETGLSTSAAQQRVRRLEQRGVIKGYTAVLDAAALGLMVTAFVAIKPFDPSQAVAWVAEAEHEVEQLVDRVAGLTGTEQIPAYGAPQIEEWGQRHQSAERRLFRA